MEQSFRMIAKTQQGLEEVLAGELTELGANDIEIGRRMVSFTGDKALLYKANFCLRTALRVLKPIKTFTAKDADIVYDYVKSVNWDQYLSCDKTFAVDAVIYSQEFRHSMFVSYRVKDAIVDYFREKTGNRPNVRINKPDVLVNIHISGTACTLSLDSSGESLHKRGYRQKAIEAPLSEVLAAGMILMSGWKGECDFIDPMCGSGTIPIEASLIARNIAPGIFREGFAFQKWNDYDEELFNYIYNDDSQEREFEHKIYAYDNSPKAIAIATANIKAAGAAKCIEIKQQPFQQFEQPESQALMMFNPPYGERISSPDLMALYEAIGERLKNAFVGGTAWILSYKDECFDKIGLKPTKKIPILNGDLECQLREYEIFKGKYKEFREGGEQLDKDPKLREASKPRQDCPEGEDRDNLRAQQHRRFAAMERGQRAKREDSGEKQQGRPWRSRGPERPFSKDRKEGQERGFSRDRKEGQERGYRKFSSNDKGPRKFSQKKEFTKRTQESYPERKRREQAEKRGEK